MFNLIPLIIVFPLLGLLTNILVGRYLGERWAGIVASLASGGAFVIAVLMAVALAGNDFHAHIVHLTTWFPLGAITIGEHTLNPSIPWAFQIDTLSVTMMLLVTGVGTLIHIYAIGYMHGDENGPRFFVYLNLFIVAMLLLVSGNNYMMLFIGWEGVGLCSFLLIGFWFDQGEDGVGNARAARKAFVVNRVGDFGMLLALFMTFWTTGSLIFDNVFEYVEVEGLATGTVTVITLLMLLGVAGKSAQIPLYVWLPDAMAGPTPVSALIHAATMVTAGIYLVVRSAPLFELAPISQAIVTTVGALTAFWAGSIAIAQYDIKRVLAFSTISQLGFMVTAVGLGGYVAGMFHLLTHAFFKALLFLASGSVIHGMEHGHHHLEHHHGNGDHREDHHHDDHFDPQDMRTMGGLKDKMPITFWVYMVGSLALAGILPFAGFWSKDEILADAFHVGFGEHPEWYGLLAYILLTIAAIFTAFYMGRQVFLTFYGPPRHEAAKHAHESPPVMTVPLIILAVLATLGGLLNLPGEILGIHLPAAHLLGDWLEHTGEVFHVIDFNIVVAITSTVLAVAAIAVSYAIYGREPSSDAQAPDPLSRMLGPLWPALENKLYVDEFYHLIIIRPFEWLARTLGFLIDWRFWHDFVHDDLIAGTFKYGAMLTAFPVDKGVVDGFFDGLAHLTRDLAKQFRRLQNGYVRNYALSVLLGAVALLSYFLFIR